MLENRFIINKMLVYFKQYGLFGIIYLSPQFIFAVCMYPGQLTTSSFKTRIIDRWVSRFKTLLLLLYTV